MTFMEMIQGLDEKHRARREQWSYIHLRTWINGYFMVMEHLDTVDKVDGWKKDDFLATDWILEELK